jgi:putative Mn2+ efflux pump MntP
MGPLEILLLALALAADAFSVGAALGLRYRGGRQTFRLAFHFGLFQALFPLAGALLGTTLLSYVEQWDHWIAFVLLGVLGCRMIRHASEGPDPRLADRDLTRGWSLVGFSVAVSLDALAAGVTLPAAGAPILVSALTIGVVTGLATLLAVRLAAAIAGRLGGRIEVAAGLVLIGLGIKIVLDHLGLLGGP